MCSVKCLFKVFVIGLIVKSGELISLTSRNGSVEELWILTDRALRNAVNGQGRQAGYGLAYPDRSPFHSPPLISNPYLSRPYSQNHIHYPYDPEPSTFMDVLDSIARNDELHCVPKLLCEFTSNSKSTQQPTLPFNLDSMLGLLSVIGPGASPLFLFGRAALLGYTARNSGACLDAFQRCPTDPDQLVHYLNNYNGGFFRFFNGLPHPGHPVQSLNSQHAHPVNNYAGPFYGAQQRILSAAATSKNQHEAIRYYHKKKGDRFATTIKFPFDDGRSSEDFGSPFYKYKSPQTLTFPATASVKKSRFYFGNESPKKTFTFPAAFTINYRPVSDYQRPPPNHMASPLIFPTRTGTGEFLLDTEKIHEDYYKSLYNQI